MTGRWLLRLPDPQARARVFCFPYSGVGASMFSRWPRAVGANDDVEICPIQLPGRENRSRDPHYGDYRTLAEELVPALLPHLDRPFAFFGHCAAALPAYETVVRLAELDLPTPSRLVVSAQVAPHHCPQDRFLDCTDDQLRAELAEQVRLRGGQPHPVLLDLAMEVLHQDLDANRIYHRDEPVPVPSAITVLHWSEDVEITEEQMSGWTLYSADTRTRVLPGGHYEFLTAPEDLLTDLAVAATAAGAAPATS